MGFWLVAGVVALLFLALLWIDLDLLLFGASMDPDRFRLEVVESILLATVLVIGLGLVAFHRLNLQRRELEARLAAETRERSALEMALIDPLTGIANRRHFDDTFHAAAAPGGAGSIHALLLLDLDGFKTVNDVHGHPAGDEVLRVVSRRLRAVVKAKDLVARTGGDEFAVIAFNLSDDAAVAAVIARIREAIEQPIVTATGTHHVSASVGAVTFPKAGAASDSVFKAADEALYREKEARRRDDRPLTPPGGAAEG